MKWFYIDIMCLVLAISAITFGNSGELWFHWASFSAGIVATVIFSIKIINDDY